MWGGFITGPIRLVLTPRRRQCEDRLRPYAVGNAPITRELVAAANLANHDLLRSRFVDTCEGFCDVRRNPALARDGIHVG
jgi:hypothetical protein